MKVAKLLALASVTGVVLATGVAAPANAWHPKGAIKKSVQNQTTASGLNDANTKETATTAKPGDTLKYVIEVRNDGAAGKTNEMHFVTLTDTLPAGVQLISDPNKRTITEDLGIIEPGKSKTKEYLVKVVASKDGELITNTACFEGDSEVRDNKQKGCDNALVTVSVPKEQPKPAPEPEKPAPVAPAPQQPPALPETGGALPLAFAFSVGSAAYAGRQLMLKRRK